MSIYVNMLTGENISKKSACRLKYMQIVFIMLWFNKTLWEVIGVTILEGYFLWWCRRSGRQLHFNKVR